MTGRPVTFNRCQSDGLTADLTRTGYFRESGKRYLRLVATFSRYAAQKGCAQVDDIDTRLIEHYLGEVPKSASTRAQAKTAIGHAMRRLGRRDPRAGEREHHQESDGPSSRASTYMRDVRGLERRYRDDVLQFARRVLAWHREDRPGQPLATLGGTDVLAFVSRVATTCVSNSTRSGVLSHLTWTLGVDTC